MKPVWGVINRHDRERFEMHLFSDGPASRVEHGYRPDPRDRFHDIAGLSNADVARLVAAEGVDVLVDLNGYSKLPRLPLFALRPAPVVVAWFGLYATSGLGGFDALCVDESVIPPEEEPFYSEPVVRLPGCYLCFEVTYPTPDVGPAPSLARGHVTFGCLAPQYKITDEAYDSWSRILRAAPSSRLVLRNAGLAAADVRRFVLDRLARRGVAPERVELLGPAEHYAFLETYGAVDLSLDSFPYNGGTTIAESLWQGVPVLAFRGDRWAARITASIMTAAGLPEFVADDLAGLEALAARLANDPETPTRLDDLRRAMRGRLAGSAACDVAGWARRLEAEYLRLWREKTAGGA
jgi:predicted O-linked N-acetylglucosamine transferase (SPINDLY family)